MGVRWHGSWHVDYLRFREWIAQGYSGTANHVLTEPEQLHIYFERGLDCLVGMVSA